MAVCLEYRLNFCKVYALAFKIHSIPLQCANAMTSYGFLLWEESTKSEEKKTPKVIIVKKIL